MVVRGKFVNLVGFMVVRVMGLLKMTGSGKAGC
jgi:hypothetical protein